MEHLRRTWDLNGEKKNQRIRGPDFVEIFNSNGGIRDPPNKGQS